MIALLSSTNEKPQVIFLDAVGTIIGLKKSVGNVYSYFAKEYKVNVDPALLDEVFGLKFSKSRPLAFPDKEFENIAALEFCWWQELVRDCFTAVGVIEQFQDWDIFFTQLYQYFASVDPWFIYPDVLIALEYWYNQKIELGVISNFDSRLENLLESLTLKNYFQSITISSQAGIAKPNREIFELALAKHKCRPQFAWHIGDSYRDDWQGANLAGLKAFLLER